MMRVVLNTNVLINSLGQRSKFKTVLDGLEAYRFGVCISTEILFEYEEMLPKFFSAQVIDVFLDTLLSSKNVLFVTPSYAFNLSSDPDDNKFVDAYLSAGADYLISNDKALLALTNAIHPPINVLTIEAFTEMLRQSS